MTDSELMAEVLQAEFEELDCPRETLIDFDLDEAGQRLQLDVDLPEIEDFPQQEARLGARELRLVLRQKSQTQLRHDTHVMWMVYYCALSVQRLPSCPAFSIQHSAFSIQHSAYGQRLNSAIAHVEDEYLISAKVERTAFEQIYDLRQRDATN